MDEPDIVAGAAALLQAKPAKSFAEAKRNARALIREAQALQEGDPRCNGKVKLRADMKRRVAPDNPYLRNADGSIQTRPCENRPIRGGTVCPFHGGKAPQVKKKAEKRLLAMVEPSLIRLEALIHQDEHMPTALGAIRTVLERAGANPIGALKTEGEKDTRQPIVIGIKVGGVPIQVTQGALPAAITEGQLVGDDTPD